MEMIMKWLLRVWRAIWAKEVAVPTYPTYPAQIQTIEQIKNKHNIRISNLEKEASVIMDKVRALEADSTVIKSTKETQIDNYVRRLSKIKRELDIREEVLNGFNSKCFQ
jgi:hypothetical protein